MDDGRASREFRRWSPAACPPRARGGACRPARPGPDRRRGGAAGRGPIAFTARWRRGHSGPRPQSPAPAASAGGKDDNRRRGGVRDSPDGHRRGPRRPRTRADAGPRRTRPRHSGRDRQQVSARASRRRAGRSGRARRRFATVRGERRGRRAVSRRVCPPPLRLFAHLHHRHRQRHDELHPVADAGRDERLRLGARRGAAPRLRRTRAVEGRRRSRCRREARHPDSRVRRTSRGARATRDGRHHDHHARRSRARARARRNAEANRSGGGPRFPRCRGRRIRRTSVCCCRAPARASEPGDQRPLPAGRRGHASCALRDPARGRTSRP